MKTDHIPDNWTITKDRYDRIVCHDEKGTKRCGGKRSNLDLPCRKYPLQGSARCKRHGGSAKRGAESENYKGKGVSKYFPQRLLAIFDDIGDDPKYNLLERNIKIKETFLREKLAMLEDTPDSAETWKDLRKQVDSLIAAFNDEQYGRCHVAILNIDKLIDERTAYHKIVDGIRSEMNAQRQDKVALEQIELRGEKAVTLPEMILLMSLIYQLFKESIKGSNIEEKSELLFASGLDKLLRIESK